MRDSPRVFLAMAKLELVESCADLLWQEYVTNTMRELEERVEALELIVEEFKKILLSRYEM